jgi:hypothetical protein
MVMDISESRTSQLHAAALQTLRGRMSEFMGTHCGSPEPPALHVRPLRRLAPRDQARPRPVVRLSARGRRVAEHPAG